MELHHFTSRLFLPAIFAEGLRLGDTPTSRTEGINAVNLTTDHRPHGQNWANRAVFSKSEIRITVEIDPGDTKLEKWTTFGEKNVDPDFYRILDRVGHGKSDCWWLYHGTIAWDQFKSVYYAGLHEYLDLKTFTFSSEEIKGAQNFSEMAQQQAKNCIEELRQNAKV